MLHHLCCFTEEGEMFGEKGGEGKVPFLDSEDQELHEPEGTPGAVSKVARIVLVRLGLNC